MRVEIWFGGSEKEAYRIEEVKEIKQSADGAFFKIIDKDGWEFETSVHNVVIIRPPKEKGGE